MCGVVGVLGWVDNGTENGDYGVSCRNGVTRPLIAEVGPGVLRAGFCRLWLVVCRLGKGLV